MNILIADHQPLIRRGILDVLLIDNEPYSIFEAGTLAEAVDIIQMNAIEIAFVDLHLGEDDGLELIDRAKQIHQTNIKFILLLATISIFEFRRARKMDIDGYILKDAYIEDIHYAFHVVKRGEKFYPAKIVEKAIYGVEGQDMRLLTERELDVFTELRKGLTNCQISSNLFITEGTTKKHVSSILNKLKLSNRMEVVVYANKLYGNHNV